MTRVIARYEGRAWLRTARSLPRSEFLAVMKAATVMVGNSSSGIIEAASLHLGVVNIGRRQAGRQRAGNTLDVKPNANAIEKAVRSIVFDTRKRKRLESAKNIYGDGRASSRIVGVLEGLEIGPDILRKQITY